MTTLISLLKNKFQITPKNKTQRLRYREQTEGLQVGGRPVAGWERRG